MNKDIQNLLSAIPFEDLWESELLWPDAMEAPDVPPKEDLVDFLEDPRKINSDLTRQIESSVACLRALKELQVEDPPNVQNSAAMTAFFQKAGIKDDAEISPSEDATPNNKLIAPPYTLLAKEVICGQIRAVRSEYQCWDGERFSRKFNFKPVDLLITSDRINRPAGDFFRAVPCSPSEIWRTEDMLCPEDVVFATVGGSQWVLHTWLGYPVSVDDLDDCLGKLSEEEMARIDDAIEALNHTDTGEITEPEWLSLERERLAERADTLPNTVDAQRWKLEAEAAIASQTKTSGNIIVFPSPVATALLAARDDAAERPLVTRLYRVTDTPASTIQISESVDATKLAFEVMEDPSGLFAGAGIFDATQKLLGKIVDGIAFVDCPKDSRFSLFATDGTPISLEDTLDEHRPQS